jgi:hypothetical protein
VETFQDEATAGTGPSGRTVVRVGGHLDSVHAGTAESGRGQRLDHEPLRAKPGGTKLGCRIHREAICVVDSVARGRKLVGETR